MHKKQLTASVDNNFANALPSTQADYANEVFRSNYNLGFLNVTEPLAETELEERLVDKVKTMTESQCVAELFKLYQQLTK